MKDMRKVVLVAFLLLTSVLSTPMSTVFAQEDAGYTTNLNLVYEVDVLGKLSITQEYEITLLDPTIYINKYGFQTTVANIYDVTVESNGNNLEANIVTNEDGSTIAFEFPEYTVGEQKKLNFSVTYKTDDLAVVSGNILEVRIPKVNQPELYETVTTELRVPGMFGEPTRINTRPSLTRDDGGISVATFIDAVEQITAIYGSDQTFDVNLRYHLQNPTSGTALTQIALPPDTSWQRVHYTTIDPPPQDFKRDEDGNWIATYQLAANTEQTVTALAQVQVSLQPNSTPIIAPFPKHTAADEYWEVGDTLFGDLSQTYKTAQSINDYVVETLQYNNLRTGGAVGRLGASQALANPTDAVCQEYTDVFVTMARAADIPARRITGYAYSQNQNLRPLSLEGDILHAWPEYFNYSENYWQPIDPTWQHTTNGVDYFSQFDVNHITFAINGTSSTKPYPAGAYKANQQDTVQDISVTPVAEFPAIQPDIGVTIRPVEIFHIPIPGIYDITYENYTGQAWYDMPVRVSDVSGAQTQVEGAFQPTVSLLPYASGTQQVVFRNPTKLQTTVQLQVTYEENGLINNEYTISTLPLPFSIAGVSVSYTAVAGVLVLSILIAGSVLVFRRR